MRKTALFLLLAALLNSLPALSYPTIEKYPLYIAGQCSTGTPGYGVPFAVLERVSVDDTVGSGIFLYKERLLYGATARQRFWVDSTAVGGTPNTWQSDGYAWANCPRLQMTNMSDTLWVWTEVRCLAQTMPEDESLVVRFRRGGNTSYGMMELILLMFPGCTAHRGV